MTEETNIQPPMVYVGEHIRWEYRVLMTDTPPTQTELNELGDAG
jgi:hypothetical protein